jgi:hypothetical protein
MKLGKGLKWCWADFAPRPHGTGLVQRLKAAGRPTPVRRAGHASARSPRTAYAWWCGRQWLSGASRTTELVARAWGCDGVASGNMKGRGLTETAGQRRGVEVMVDSGVRRCRVGTVAGEVNGKILQDEADEGEVRGNITLPKCAWRRCSLKEGMMDSGALGGRCNTLCYENPN